MPPPTRACTPLLLLLLPACTVPIDGRVDVDRLPPIAGNIHTTTDARLVGGQVRADVNVNGRLDGRLALEGPINIHINGPGVRYEGTFVPKSSFERIATGTTRADWVLAVIGKPDSAATLDDGSVVWKWQYAPVEQSGSLVTLFGSSKDEPSPQPVICILRLENGVVVEKWRD